MATGNNVQDTDSQLNRCDMEVESINRYWNTLKQNVKLQDLERILRREDILSRTEWNTLREQNVVGCKVREAQLTEAFLKQLVLNRSEQKFIAFRGVLRQNGYEDLADKLDAHLSSITKRERRKPVEGRMPREVSANPGISSDGFASVELLNRMNIMLETHENAIKELKLESAMQNKRMSQQIRELKKELAEKKSELQKLQNVHQELTEMRREVSKLNTERQNTFDEYMKEKNQKELIIKTLDTERQNWSREKTDFNMYLDTARGETRDLTAQLEEARKNLASLEQRVHDYENPLNRSTTCVLQ